MLPICGMHTKWLNIYKVLKRLFKHVFMISGPIAKTKLDEITLTHRMPENTILICF